MLTVLVVDPRAHFRNVLAEGLRRWFTVHTAYDEPSAFAAVSCFTPAAVLISLVQATETTGLDLARRARRLTGGKGSAIVVYGLAGDSAPSPERLRALERQSGVDLFLAERLEPDELRSRILGLLLRLDAVASGVGIAGAGRAANEAGTALSARRVVHPADASWSSLLRHDLSGPVLKEILSRGVPVADVERYDSTAEIPWSELFRAPVTPNNLRRVVSKAIKAG